MNMRRNHLSDDRLIDVCLDKAGYAAERNHLDSCPECAERGAHLSRMLTDVAAVTVAEADAAFSVDRLAKQRARILQRLEQEGRAGRVITFPGNLTQRPSLRARPGMRWVAGAAAAGLLIGVAAGHLAHVVSPNQWRGSPTQMVLQPPGTTLHAVSTTLSEEEFLGMLEVAIEGTSGASLRPLDDLTPLVWEVAAQ
jgi:anti-sigma factor RsiW